MDETTPQQPAPNPPPQPTPAEDTRRRVEEWAKEKGDLRVRADGSPDPTLPRYWRFRAAQIGERWAAEQEVTEAEYDAALRSAEGTTVR